MSNVYRKEEKIRLVFSILWTIVLMILNIVGYIKYLNGDTSWLLVLTIFNVIDLFSSEGNIVVAVPFCIGSLIATKKFFLAIQLGLIFENVFVAICTIFYYAKLIIMFNKLQK